MTTKQKKRKLKTMNKENINIKSNIPDGWRILEPHETIRDNEDRFIFKPYLLSKALEYWSIFKGWEGYTVECLHNSYSGIIAIRRIETAANKTISFPFQIKTKDRADLLFTLKTLVGAGCKILTGNITPEKYANRYGDWSYLTVKETLLIDGFKDFFARNGKIISLSQAIEFLRDNQKPKTVEVKLNDKITVVVDKEKVQVPGYGNFKTALVDDILAAIKKVSQSFDIKNICIKTNNRAEKLLALHVMKSLKGSQICEDKGLTLNQTIENKGIFSFPYVVHNGGYNIRAQKIYTISDLPKLMEDYYDSQTQTVKLSDEYSAVISKENVVIGCQTFTHTVFETLKNEIDKLNE